ncbi:ROK family protein [Aureimonas mangrovi]|uniref:ROK family protein n=1 Tax=Aureimonas mangrovi TaxID=2758041 RepID=UPI00163D7A7E|nr:ROK family protein [Aureimonas mangrovi]
MLSKTDAEAVRRQNRRLSIEHFRRAGASTRRRLSEATGLSFSAASSIASDLLREGVLSEDEAAAVPARRGRPEFSLSLSPARALLAAVKVTVGEVAVHICDYAGGIVAARSREADLLALDGPALVDAVEGLIDATLDEGRIARLDRIVVAVQGVTDSASRRLLWSPILKARDTDMATSLEARFAAPVTVANDCGLMPERFRWSGEIDEPAFATLFIGFGVGMGLKLSGSTFRGARSSAVEFGHLNHIPGGEPCRCGNHGCIEAYAGDYAIWRAARGANARHLGHRVDEMDMAELAQAARAGERLALAAYERAGEALGYGLGRMFTLIDPVPVAFVGSGAAAMDLLEPAIRRGIAVSAIEGIGRDTPFFVFPDSDEVLLDASLAFGLAAIDDELAGAIAPAGRNMGAEDAPAPLMGGMT